MKRYGKFLPVTICASVVLHAGIFLFFSVTSKSLASSPNPSPGAFSLINIAVLPDPFIPEPPAPVPEPPAIPAAVPELPPEDWPAEIFIPVEEIPQTEEAPHVEIPAALQIPAATGPERAGETGSAAQASPETAEKTAAYVRRNYSYIQRRIRDALVYPSQARRAGIQGVTELGFTIHQDGKVSGVTVLVSSGQDSLDQAAIAAIHAAAPFRPPPAPARLAIPVAFRLR
jgi:protein TonB